MTGEDDDECKDDGNQTPFRLDGGWGWVIVAASFLNSALVEGTICVIGAAMQPEWEVQYSSSAGATAFAVSILAGTYCIVGPFSGALVDVYGCRRVVIVGTLISFGGFMASALATSLIYLYFSFGIIVGVGFGLMYLPSIVVISEYFEKRRALATCIVSCGSGIGTFIWTPLIRFMLHNFTWNQTLIIMAAIILNGLVCGALYRPQQPEPPSEPLDPIPTHLAENDSQNLANPFFAKMQEQEPRIINQRQFVSSLDVGAHTDHVFGEAMPTAMQTPTDSDTPLIPQLKRILHGMGGSRPLSRKDVFFTGSRAALERLEPIRPQQLFTGRVRKISCSMPALDLVPVQHHAIQYQVPSVNEDLTECGKLKLTLCQMVDVSLMRSPTYLTLCAASFLTMAAFYVPYIYLPRLAQQAGYSEDNADYLISILGIANICARVICGWLSDHPLVDALIVRNVFVTLGGVATVLVPLMHSYWLFCVYCVLFAFTTGSFGGLASVICVELLGIEKLTSAYGILLTFYGVATLLGAPLAGTMADLTGNFDAAFYLMGGLLTLSGVMCWPLKTISRWEAKRDLMRTQNKNDLPEIVTVTIHPKLQMIKERSFLFNNDN